MNNEGGYMVAKGNRMVTLSIYSAIYGVFQKYCEENTVMLSKRIEYTNYCCMHKKEQS